MDLAPPPSPQLTSLPVTFSAVVSLSRAAFWSLGSLAASFLSVFFSCPNDGRVKHKASSRPARRRRRMVGTLSYSVGAAAPRRGAGSRGDPLIYHRMARAHQ